MCVDFRFLYLYIYYIKKVYVLHIHMRTHYVALYSKWTCDIIIYNILYKHI